MKRTIKVEIETSECGKYCVPECPLMRQLQKVDLGSRCYHGFLNHDGLGKKGPDPLGIGVLRHPDCIKAEITSIGESEEI